MWSRPNRATHYTQFSIRLWSDMLDGDNFLETRFSVAFRTGLVAVVVVVVAPIPLLSNQRSKKEPFVDTVERNCLQIRLIGMKNDPLSA